MKIKRMKIKMKGKTKWKNVNENERENKNKRIWNEKKNEINRDKYKDEREINIK
jgi:hypothetical protein